MATTTSLRVDEDLLSRADALIPHVRAMGRHASASRATVLREATALGLRQLEEQDQARKADPAVAEALEALAQRFEEAGEMSREELFEWMLEPGVMDDFMEFFRAAQEGDDPAAESAMSRLRASRSRRRGSGFGTPQRRTRLEYAAKLRREGLSPEQVTRRVKFYRPGK